MSIIYIIVIVLMSAVYLYSFKHMKDDYDAIARHDYGRIEKLTQENKVKTYNIKSLVKHVNEMQAYVIQRDEQIKKKNDELARLNMEMRKLYDEINEVRQLNNNKEDIETPLPDDPWNDDKITEEDIYLRGMEKFIEKLE